MLTHESAGIGAAGDGYRTDVSRYRLEHVTLQYTRASGFDGLRIPHAKQVATIKFDGSSTDIGDSEERFAYVPRSVGSTARAARQPRRHPAYSDIRTASANGLVDCPPPPLVEEFDHAALLGDECVDAGGLGVDEVSDCSLLGERPIGHGKRSDTFCRHVKDVRPSRDAREHPVCERMPAPPGEEPSIRRRSRPQPQQCVLEAARPIEFAAHDLYHDDAILEFPQSGERFEGVDNFRAWREQYPVPTKFRMRRLSGSGDVWVREVSVSYDGGPWMMGVAMLEFDGDRVRRERIYVTERWEAPEWRAQWRATTPAE